MLRTISLVGPRAASNPLLRPASDSQGSIGRRRPTGKGAWTSGREEAFEFARVGGFIRGDRPSYPTDMLVPLIWVNPEDLVYGLGEVFRVLADGRETPWHRFLDPGTPVIGRARKPRVSGAVMVCKGRSRSISLCGSGMDGLTIVLMTDHPDEKRNVKGSCPFLGTLLPLVVEDVGRIDP